MRQILRAARRVRFLRNIRRSCAGRPSEDVNAEREPESKNMKISPLACASCLALIACGGATSAVYTLFAVSQRLRVVLMHLAPVLILHVHRRPERSLRCLGV